MMKSQGGSWSIIGNISSLDRTSGALHNTSATVMGMEFASVELMR